MKERWSALPFALGAAVVLILSFWIPSSPYLGALLLLTGFQSKLLARPAPYPKSLDPWLLAYLAVTVLNGLVLVGLGRRLGAKTTRWLISASGLCMALLVLLPVGVLLLAFVYLSVEVLC